MTDHQAPKLPTKLVRTWNEQTSSRWWSARRTRVLTTIAAILGSAIIALPVAATAPWAVVVLAAFPVIVASAALGLRAGLGVTVPITAAVAGFSMLERPPHPVGATVGCVVLLVSATLVGRLRDRLDRSYREMDYRAGHDPVTGLPNRALLMRKLDDEIRFARRVAGAVSLVYVDLDRFLEINSSLGRAAGDAVLAETGRRLAGLGGSRQILARVGGDEFALVLPGTEEVEAFEVAKRAIRALSAPIEVGGQQVESGAAVGVATSDPDLDAEGLVRRAETAKHAARGARSGVASFSPKLARGLGDLNLLSELRDAIDTGQLVLQYQPQVSLRTGRTVAMEGLVRWQHPRLGLLQPGDFMPMAERSGLIHPLFEWILATGLDHCRHWLRSGLDAPVVVNLSIRNLLDPDLPALIGNMLEARGMDGRWLMLDANEGDTMVDTARIKANAAALLRLGVRMSIDNFGMGYSSLTQLNHLPISGVKMDSSIVSRMAGNWSSEAIVRSMVGLIHSLGFQVIAVGVEDLASWKMLAELGCDAAQGFFIKGPTGVGALQEWVDASLGRHTSSERELERALSAVGVEARSLEAQLDAQLPGTGPAEGPATTTGSAVA